MWPVTVVSVGLPSDELLRDWHSYLAYEIQQSANTQPLRVHALFERYACVLPLPLPIYDWNYYLAYEIEQSANTQSLRVHALFERYVCD